MEGSKLEEWEELLGSGVRRKVLVQGTGDCPEHGHLVLFNWEGSITPARVLFTSRTEASTRIGDGDEIPGLELALRHMRVGEKCLVQCETRFAYGPDGCPATRAGDQDVPPDADVELVVELLQVLSTTTLANLSPEEKVPEFLRRKMVGNEHYARKAFKKALRSYLSVITSIADADFPDDCKDEARQLQIDCGNNVTMVYMRLGKLEQAKEAAIEVLQLDATNSKALFRAGQISSQEGNFAEAKMALRKALEANPESSEVKAELGRLASRVEAYKTRRRAIQKTMGRSLFAGSNRDPGDDESQGADGREGEGESERESKHRSEGGSEGKGKGGSEGKGKGGSEGKGKGGSEGKGKGGSEGKGKGEGKGEGKGKGEGMGKGEGKGKSKGEGEGEGRADGQQPRGGKLPTQPGDADATVSSDALGNRNARKFDGVLWRLVIVPAVIALSAWVAAYILAPLI